MKKLIATSSVLVVALSAGLTTVAGAAPAANPSLAPLREFEGTVVSVNQASRTFRLNDSERGTVRIKITRNTRFERVAGLGGLKAGQRFIEAKVRRIGGVWRAVEVERSGGGGEHGGRDDDDGRDDDGGRDD